MHWRLSKLEGCRQAAVDHQRLASDITRVGPDEERRRARHLVGRSRAAQGKVMSGDVVILKPRRIYDVHAVFNAHRRVDKARRNGVDEDSPIRQLHRQIAAVLTNRHRRCPAVPRGRREWR